VPQGNECVAILVAEPEAGLLRVTYRVGSRHPLALGAAGVAILAGRPERSDDSDNVRQARADGFSVTRGQLQRGAIGIACPLHDPRQPAPGFEASLGVVTVGEADVPQLTAAVMTYVKRLKALLKATV
jgi:DNA-binding IclR family transcriptional regulator